MLPTIENLYEKILSKYLLLMNDNPVFDYNLAETLRPLQDKCNMLEQLESEILKEYKTHNQDFKKLKEEIQKRDHDALREQKRTLCDLFDEMEKTRNDIKNLIQESQSQCEIKISIIHRQIPNALILTERNSVTYRTTLFNEAIEKEKKHIQELLENFKKDKKIILERIASIKDSVQKEILYKQEKLNSYLDYILFEIDKNSEKLEAYQEYFDLLLETIIKFQPKEPEPLTGEIIRFNSCFCEFSQLMDDMIKLASYDRELIPFYARDNIISREKLLKRFKQFIDEKQILLFDPSSYDKESQADKDAQVVKWFDNVLSELKEAFSEFEPKKINQTNHDICYNKALQNQKAFIDYSKKVEAYCLNLQYDELLSEIARQLQIINSKFMEYTIKGETEQSDRSVDETEQSDGFFDVIIEKIKNSLIRFSLYIFSPIIFLFFKAKNYLFSNKGNEHNSNVQKGNQEKTSDELAEQEKRDDVIDENKKGGSVLNFSRKKATNNKDENPDEDRKTKHFNPE